MPLTSNLLQIDSGYLSQSSVLKTNCVVWLDASNTGSYSTGASTVWNDISGNGNNFTLTNTVYTGTQQALVFNGSSAYAVSSTNLQSYFGFTNYSQTQECWFYNINNSTGDLKIEKTKQ